jgi:hypothetical protein
VSYGRHFQEANEQLLTAMESDADFASQMKELGIEMERTPRGVAPRTSPRDWVWHHHQEEGILRLVPKVQHTPGSPFWDILHPDGVGGMAIWGQ